MAKSKNSKKIMNMVYGLGAAVVILGALFKIMHWPGAGPMLIAGLVTEALVFTISAFEPVDNELDWSLVYPELAGGASAPKNVAKKQDVKEAEVSLSKKLDDMLKEAKIDGALMSSLGESIKNFEGAAKGIAPTADAMTSQKKYSEEMTLAAAQMESLNNLYKVQVESASKQAEVNQAVADNAVKLKAEMESLTSNLSSLNNVYGGMLTAMRPQA
ncbi:gliding motility protein GldL [Mesonia mobilis]|uniref:Gliding motility protein GldL n=1 Tax=Mesonia mobilis TaxID=369791 RepID=A0ABQ3BKF8_9FLAO|nr:gliding motility protein GldL [Mesonia mobilis]MBQ0736756.1 gliding motility protein GldL [Aquimarina celericrescens]GGZ45326.1 gliding motility protein GldL [Mesonia mobilis]|tara:strand:- start:243 stop:887 length:645 start_codon:yes stop_codon:yes gene_type:complete